MPLFAAHGYISGECCSFLIFYYTICSQLWNEAECKQVRLSGHLSSITALTFNPSHVLLASACSSGWLNIWSVADATLVQTITGAGSCSALSWHADHSLAASFSRSKDVHLVHMTSEHYRRHKVLAVSRGRLRQHGIVGLHKAPCLRALLLRLPLILQEQFSHEKVCISLRCGRSYVSCAPDFCAERRAAAEQRLPALPVHPGRGSGAGPSALPQPFSSPAPHSSRELSAQ